MSQFPLQQPIRVQPFTGLVIDVDTWATAHDYHRRQHQLHLLSLHGAGIASGLEVLPTDPPSDDVLVQPGVAIDQLGNAIVVPEMQRVSLDAKEGCLYVVLDYVESLPPTKGQDSRGRLLEDFRLRALPEMPESPSLELARIETAKSSKTVIVAAANPWSPGPNEIDVRHRSHSQPKAAKELTVGLVVCGSAETLDPEHLRGFHHFLREMGSCGLRPTLASATGNKVPAADLLYITGSAKTEPAAALVKAILDRAKAGSWLFADACGQGDAFVQGLSAAVKSGPKTGTQTESRVLGSHFVFGSAPGGASDGGEIVWGRNIVISPRDYGCAWSGRRGGKGLPREQIRSALEFGVNVAVAASTS